MHPHLDRRVDTSIKDDCDSPASHHEIKENSAEKMEVEHKEDTLEQALHQKGFKNSIFGFILVSYISLISIFWIAVLLVLCLDYYGYVREHV